MAGVRPAHNRRKKSVAAAVMTAHHPAMNLEEFLQSAARDDEPPASLTSPLRALWFAERSDWSTSHQIAQELHTREGSWIHAHLHREEGDHWNARYWYNQAGKPVSKKSLADERHEIIAALLG